MFVVVQAKFIAPVHTPYHLTSSAGAPTCEPHHANKSIYIFVIVPGCLTVYQNVQSYSSQIDEERGFSQHPPWSMDFTKKGV